jgi:hypothetical protein
MGLIGRLAETSISNADGLDFPSDCYHLSKYRDALACLVYFCNGLAAFHWCELMAPIVGCDVEDRTWVERWNSAQHQVFLPSGSEHEKLINSQ